MAKWLYGESMVEQDNSFEMPDDAVPVGAYHLTSGHAYILWVTPESTRPPPNEPFGMESEVTGRRVS